MGSLETRIAYLRGLVDGMEFNNIKEKQLNFEIIKVLDEMTKSINEMEEVSYETQEYLEIIDEDLNKLEENFYSDDNCDCDVGILEDDDFLEIECSNCNEIIYIDRNLVNEEVKIKCPSCKANIILD